MFRRGRAGRIPRKPPKLTNLSVNVHGWWVELEEGIVVAGFGGDKTSGVAGLLADIRAWHAERAHQDRTEARAASATAPLQILLLTHLAPECDGFQHGARSEVRGSSISEQGDLRRVLVDAESQRPCS